MYKINKMQNEILKRELSKINEITTRKTEIKQEKPALPPKQQDNPFDFGGSSFEQPKQNKQTSPFGKQENTKRPLSWPKPYV